MMPRQLRGPVGSGTHLVLRSGQLSNAFSLQLSPSGGRVGSCCWVPQDLGSWVIKTAFFFSFGPPKRHGK